MGKYLGRPSKRMVHYLARNYRLCIMVLLVIAEMIVYSAINAEPTIEGYMHYLNDTLPRYSSDFAFIFIENTKTSLRILLSGLIPFFAGTVFSSFSVIYSMTGGMKCFLQKLPPSIILKGTLPHGIFELLEILLSLLLSVLISKEVTMIIIARSQNSRTMKERTSGIGISFSCWLFIGIPLLLLAALIETYITPMLL